MESQLAKKADAGKKDEKPKETSGDKGKQPEKKPETKK